MIAAVLLAAGRSVRFGGAKLLAPLWGQSVVRWSAGILASAVDDLVVVVPDGDSAIRAALDEIRARFVENDRRDTGMASSIVAGIGALPGECEAVVIALGDQPTVRAEVIVSLVARWSEGGADAVVPIYDDGRGHPVLFGRRCFSALTLLTGDVGASSVLSSLGDAVAHVRVAGPAPAGADTPEQLERLARGARPGT